MTNFYFVSNKRGEIKNEQSRDTGNKVQKIQNEEKKAKNKTKNKNKNKKTKNKNKKQKTHSHNRKIKKMSNTDPTKKSKDEPKTINSSYKTSAVLLKIRVITKLLNTEKSSKGKGKTHKSTNRQNQSTTGKLGNPQWSLQKRL